jgi:hypothetical protein
MIKLPSHKKQRACEQLSFACPPRPDLKRILPLFFFSGAWIQEQRSVVSPHPRGNAWKVAVLGLDLISSSFLIPSGSSPDSSQIDVMART